jgi:DNA-directed RNA polymerase subunit RPC12/RpoP
MESQERVCVTCHRVFLGNDLLLKPMGSSQSVTSRFLCPECSYRRFPQFYSDYKKANSPETGISRIFSFLR